MERPQRESPDLRPSRQRETVSGNGRRRLPESAGRRNAAGLCAGPFGRSRLSHGLSGKVVIPSLIGSTRVRAYDFRNYWRDIGTLDSYYESNMDLVSEVSPHRSVLSPGVEIEPGAKIERSVVMSGVRIGRGARIRKAI